jgi:DNA modification methylase
VHLKKGRKLQSKLKSDSRIRIVNYNHDFGELVLFASNKYQPVHRWYHFVEGYSSELVRRIIGEQKQLPLVCLDPFGGVGTTALTCQDFGVKCLSFENNPFFYNLSRTKLRSDYDADVFEELIVTAEEYLRGVKNKPSFPKLETDTLFESQDKDRWVFNADTAYGLFDILGWINKLVGDEATYKGLFECALSSVLVPVSNVYRNGKCLSYKNDWHKQYVSRREVHNRFLDICRNIILIDIRTRKNSKSSVHNYIHYFKGDSRVLIGKLRDDSIDIVITSPPYLNSRDYTDIYRLELWILGYLSTFEEERKLRKSALRSHVQITWDDCEYPKVRELDLFMKHIHSLNGTLWNKNIPNMIKGYFADMHNMLSGLRPKIKKGAKLYINVANSAYGNKTCEVDVIIAKIAQQIGYAPIEIREVRHVKSSRQQKEVDKLRESIIVLKRE